MEYNEVRIMTIHTEAEWLEERVELLQLQPPQLIQSGCACRSKYLREILVFIRSCGFHEGWQIFLCWSSFCS